MTTEPNNFIADGVFEAQYNTYSDNHYSQSNGNADCGYMDGRATHLVAVTFVTMDSTS
jgi:hypothetical protein